MSANIVEKRVYYWVFAALLVLLLITVAAVNIEHRPTAAVVAVTIAMIKAVLIVLFFMHVAYSTSLVRVFAAAGFVWLTILLALTASDYLTRKPEVEHGSVVYRTDHGSRF